MDLEKSRLPHRSLGTISRVCAWRFFGRYGPTRTLRKTAGVAKCNAALTCLVHRLRIGTQSMECSARGRTKAMGRYSGTKRYWLRREVVAANGCYVVQDIGPAGLVVHRRK